MTDYLRSYCDYFFFVSIVDVSVVSALTSKTGRRRFESISGRIVYSDVQPNLVHSTLTDIYQLEKLKAVLV